MWSSESAWQRARGARIQNRHRRRTDATQITRRRKIQNIRTSIRRIRMKCRNYNHIRCLLLSIFVFYVPLPHCTTESLSNTKRNYYYKILIIGANILFWWTRGSARIHSLFFRSFDKFSADASIVFSIIIIFVHVQFSPIFHTHRQTATNRFGTINKIESNNKQKIYIQI